MNNEKITQEFIWNEIVPIARRFDPQYVELLPMGFFYDTQPEEWKKYFDKKESEGEWSCLSECWEKLKVPKEVSDAHTDSLRYSKEKWECANECWTWDYFKDMLFTPSRKEIVWDSMLLNLKSNSMSFSTLDKDGWFCKMYGYAPNAFERGEQVGILLHPDSHYKGWANCKMWYEL